MGLASTVTVLVLHGGGFIGGGPGSVEPLAADLIVPLDQGMNYYRAARRVQTDTTFTLMTISPHAYWNSYRTLARQWIEARWPARGTTARSGGAVTKGAHVQEALVKSRVLPKCRMKRHGQQDVLLRRYRVPVH